MKTSALKIGLFAALGVFAAACNDDDDNKNTAKLTSQEQADIVASSVGNSGFTGSASYTASQVESSGGVSGKIAECGFSNSGSFSIENAVFMLSYSYSIALECNASNEPERFTSSFTYSGFYDGQKFYTDHDGEGDLVITNLTDGSEYELNGSYDRSGEFEYTNGDKVSSGSHVIDIDANDITIKKETKKITGGTATVRASGVMEGRGTYSFTAQITFNEDGSTAILRVSGDEYSLNLENSTVVKID